MNLSRKITLIFSVCVLSGAVIAVLFDYFAVGGFLQHFVATNQQNMAIATMDKIDRFEFERNREIQSLAYTVPLIPSSSQLTAKFQKVVGLNDFWNNICLLDKTGTCVVSAADSDRGIYYLKLHQSLPALFAEALSGKAVDSEAVKMVEDDQPSQIILAPVRDKTGAIVGVLVGEIKWDTIHDILSEIKGSQAYLLDESGRELGNNSSDELGGALQTNWSHAALFNGLKPYEQSGSGSVYGPGLGDENDVHLVSYVPQKPASFFQGTRWKLVVTTNMETVMEPGREVSLILAAILVGALVISMASMMVILRRKVSRPLQQLTAAAHRISEGEIKQSVAIQSSDEIGELSKSFNSMSVQLAVSRDLIEEERARLNSSIQNLPLGFMMTDKDLNAVLVNRLMQKILGQETTQTKPGSLLDKIMTPAEHAIRSKKPVKLKEIQHNNKIYRLLVSPVMSETEVIGTVLLVEDITETVVLARSRDEFFSIASHELRTPLTAIRGNTSMIQSFYAKKIKDPELNDMIDDIHESSLRLIEIVNDFLDTSRLELNKMHFTYETVEIDRVIEQVVYEMAGLSRAKKVTIKLDHNIGVLPKVRADKNRLKQVIYNLVGNAMKFVEKGVVEISVQPEGDVVCVRIIDTGPGISRENQKLLFHKFQQATTNILTRDSTRGTGLGLYISKMIVEKMGGKIKLEKSELGVGSTFSFTVPIAEETKDI